MLLDFTAGLTVTCTNDYCYNTAAGVDEYRCVGTRECYCGSAKACFNTGGYSTDCQNAETCTATDNNDDTYCGNSKYCYNIGGRGTKCGNAEFCYSGDSYGVSCQNASICMGWNNNADMYCQNAGSCVNERSRDTLCGNAKSCRAIPSYGIYCQNATSCLNGPLEFVEKVKIGVVSFGSTPVGMHLVIRDLDFS
jgi:hypothetical protein